MQTQSPFFTVIVPVIRGLYLAQAVRSVLEQSFGDLELIVIDDASADPIAEILAPFRKDSRLTFIQNSRNRGSVSPAIVWNQGLALARGRLTMILGDDDFYGPGVLGSIHAMAVANPHVALFRVRLMKIDGNNAFLASSGRLPEFEPWWDLLYARATGRQQSICEHAFDTEWLRKKGQFWELPKAWGSDDAATTALASIQGCISDSSAMAYMRMDGKNLSSLIKPEYTIAIKQLIDWQKELVLQSSLPEYMPRDLLLRCLDERLNYCISVYQPKKKTVFDFVKSQIKQVIRYS